jgi:hypothetical protein
MKKIVFLEIVTIFVCAQASAMNNRICQQLVKIDPALKYIQQSDWTHFKSLNIDKNLAEALSGAADLRKRQLQNKIIKHNTPSWRTSSFFIYLVTTSAFSMVDIYYYMNNTPTSPGGYAKMTMDLGRDLLFIPVAYAVIKKLIPNKLEEKLKNVQAIQQSIIEKIVCY